MQRFLFRNVWWMVSLVAGLLLLSHTFGWSTVDNTSLVLVGIILFSPFLTTLKKIKVGDFEAEIDSQEVRRVKDQVEAQVADAATPEVIRQTPPEIRDAVTGIQELSKSDHVMAVAKLRIELEKLLKKIYVSAFPEESDLYYRGIGAMIRRMTTTEVLDPSITSPLQEVISLCNRAVHGEEVRPNDAVVIVEMGTTLLVRLNEELAHFAPRPKETTHIEIEEVQRYRTATYRIVTVTPYTEQPIRNVYYLDQDGLDRFLKDYSEFAEFIVEMAEVSSQGQP